MGVVVLFLPYLGHFPEILALAEVPLEYYRLLPASRNNNEDEEKRANPRLVGIGERSNGRSESLTSPMCVGKLDFNLG